MKIDKEYHKHCINYINNVVPKTKTEMMFDKNIPSGMSYDIHQNQIYLRLDYLGSRYYSVIAHEMTHALNSIGRQQEVKQLIEKSLNYIIVHEKAVDIRADSTVGVDHPQKTIIKAVLGVKAAISEFNTINLSGQYNVLVNAIEIIPAPINVFRAVTILFGSPEFNIFSEWIQNKRNNQPNESELQQQINERISNLTELRENLGDV